MSVCGVCRGTGRTMAKDKMVRCYACGGSGKAHDVYEHPERSLVERLRDVDIPICLEAADEIERLTKERDFARQALNAKLRELKKW